MLDGLETALSEVICHTDAIIEIAVSIGLGDDHAAPAPASPRREGQR